jgi:hypothetical protein
MRQLHALALRLPLPQVRVDQYALNAGRRDRLRRRRASLLALTPPWTGCWPHRGTLAGCVRASDSRLALRSAARCSTFGLGRCIGARLAGGVFRSPGSTRIAAARFSGRLSGGRCARLPCMAALGDGSSSRLRGSLPSVHIARRGLGTNASEDTTPAAGIPIAEAKLQSASWRTLCIRHCAE